MTRSFHAAASRPSLRAVTSLVQLIHLHQRLTQRHHLRQDVCHPQVLHLVPVLLHLQRNLVLIFEMEIETKCTRVIGDTSGSTHDDSALLRSEHGQ